MNDSRVKKAVYFQENNKTQMQRGCVPQLQEYNVPQQYTYNSYQDYDNKLCHNYYKTEMEIYKNSVVLEQKLNYQEHLKIVRSKYDADKQLTSAEIYKDSCDRLIYALNNPDGSRLSGKELLNARGYKSYIYFSIYPYLQRILAVSWNYEKYNIYFPYDNGEVKISSFVRKINSHGLYLLVSGRTQKEAASALLAYSIENAKLYELPFDSGWWKDTRENWHFSKKGSLTMKGVKDRIEW